MNESSEQILRSYLEGIKNRIEALDRIEEKLCQLRELAVYAAGRTLNEKEANEIQEWVNILSSEIKKLDQSTAIKCTNPTS